MTANLLGQARRVYPAASANTPPSANEITVFDNFNATSDPGVNQDSTQGYKVGSMYYNTVGLRRWVCTDNTSGAARWVYDGADFAHGGTLPNNANVDFAVGNAVAPGAELFPAGTLYRDAEPTGVNPAFIGGDIVVAVYSIPAGTFGTLGTSTVKAQAWGGFSPDATSKRVKMFFSPNIQTASTTVSGGTLIADTGATVSNGGGWWVSGNVTRYGTSTSNTQLLTSTGSLTGQGVAAPGAMLPPSLTTGLVSTSLYISVTCNNTSSTMSSTYSLMIVEGMN